MSISEKIKAINNKYKQNKTQYNLDWKISKISALSSFLSSDDVLPQKDLLEKAAIMKRFKYLLLGKELKTQTDIVKKQY